MQGGRWQAKSRLCTVVEQLKKMHAKSKVSLGFGQHAGPELLAMALLVREVMKGEISHISLEGSQGPALNVSLGRFTNGFVCILK